MNDLVKNSIESRKQAVLNRYKIEDKELLNKIDELFSKISQFGENCIDSMDFETKFASSTLNKEYIELFTQIATSCTPIIHEVEERDDIKSDKEYILEDVKGEVKYQIESATQPLRREAYQETYDKVRDIPIVGDVLNVKQHIDFFSKFKKKKDK